MAMKEEHRARLLIGAGTGIALFGVVLSVNDDDLGRFLIVLGVAMLFVALHRFGRLGPDTGSSV
jgi:drug/metabolite transporter (DMT)-like permease